MTLPVFITVIADHDKPQPSGCLLEENLKDIDALITAEMVSGKGRVNRSDVVRAAVEALKTLSKTEVSRLIAEVKQR